MEGDPVTKVTGVTEVTGVTDTEEAAPPFWNVTWNV